MIEGVDMIPTEYYNNLILEDIYMSLYTKFIFATLKQFPSLIQVIQLFKVHSTDSFLTELDLLVPTFLVSISRFYQFLLDDDGSLPTLSTRCPS